MSADAIVVGAGIVGAACAAGLAARGMAVQGLDAGGRPASTEAAWRSLETAGGTRPELDMEQELLKTKADRAAMEQAADAQLAHLKKKLGRE